jgi:methionyl-tRNA formyltransferase
MKPRILFMGTPEFAVPALQKLLNENFPVIGVVCQPDRPQGRHMTRQAPPVKMLAEAYGLPVLQPEKLRPPAFEDAVRELAPEMIVTAAYGRILPANILDIPPLGCLNIHASLLPGYRGAAPIHWCLIRGEQQTGVTIMLMDEGMDTGDILLQRSVPIPEDMDAGRLSEILAALGADMLPAAIAGWLDGSLMPQPQDELKATVISLMTRAIGQIDWQKPSRDIHNLIRGTSPWPGAFTWCGPRRIKIHKARICTDPAILAAGAGLEPGVICLCSGDTISVTCGNGVLDLLEIQSDSGKRLSCRDCAHNYRLGQIMGGVGS